MIHGKGNAPFFVFVTYQTNFRANTLCLKDYSDKIDILYRASELDLCVHIQQIGSYEVVIVTKRHLLNDTDLAAILVAIANFLTNFVDNGISKKIAVF